MSSHDDDILDFDFFEDDATREPQGAGGAGATPRGPSAAAAAAGRGGRSCGRRTG